MSDLLATLSLVREANSDNSLWEVKLTMNGSKKLEWCYMSVHRMMFTHCVVTTSCHNNMMSISYANIPGSASPEYSSHEPEGGKLLMADVDTIIDQ
jgi:hypothetical protein